jgi:hypothetical protein
VTWTKLDDRFTDDPVWENVSLAGRWHYLALIEQCTRYDRFDGRVPLDRARRASDVDDPDACVSELVKAGLLAVDDEAVTVVRIAEQNAYVLPPYLRDENRKPAQNERKRRSRENRKKGTTESESRVMSRVTPGSGSGSGSGKTTTATTATTEGSRAREADAPGAARSSGMSSEHRSPGTPRRPDLNSYAPPGWRSREEREQERPNREGWGS